MANNFDSNTSRKVMRSFLNAFETERVMSKNVNTQLYQGAFTPQFGDTIDVKRPTDYVADRTATGDVSGGSPSDIITGKASATVQNFFTVRVAWDSLDEAIKADQIDELLAPAAKRIVTDLEVDFAAFMRKNAGLLAGTYGTAVSTWDHVAEAGAVLQATGVPMDKPWCAAVNPYTQRKLASNQRSLGAGERLVETAHEKALISSNFAGLDVYTATALSSVTSGAGADRVGALAANPDVTYATHKDTMLQSLSVNGFQANLPIKAGEVIKITGRNRLNLSTRQPIIDETGVNVEFTATVAADVTLDGTGAGVITVKGPAIYEATGAYNTVDSAPVSGDVVTLLGAASTLYQPNLFWHKDAFAIASVPLKKLYSTDTIATTSDGLQLRVSKYADGDKNQQTVRFDFVPAYAALNPFFAGQLWGS